MSNRLLVYLACNSLFLLIFVTFFHIKFLFIIFIYSFVFFFFCKFSFQLFVFLVIVFLIHFHTTLQILPLLELNHLYFFYFLFLSSPFLLMFYSKPLGLNIYHKSDHFSSLSTPWILSDKFPWMFTIKIMYFFSIMIC